ncbi:MAG: TolC family protein [Chitinophagaceae bacterium]
MKRLFKPLVFIFLAAASLYAAPATAQNTRNITLKEVIDLSIKNNKELKYNKAQILEAIAATKEAMERKLPDVKVSGSLMALNNPHINLKTGGKDTSNGSGSKAQAVKVNQIAYGLVNVSLPIYAGLRIQYGIESAQYLEKAISLDAENNKEEVILNSVNAFSNLYKARKAEEVVKESLAQARARAVDFANLEKNGLLARNDYLKAELQASNIELSLLETEKNRRVATSNLDIMLGLPQTTDLVADSASLMMPTDTKNIDEWEQLALQNRKDVEALSYREKAARTAIKATKGEMYPSLALTGGYVALYVPNLVTVVNAVNIGVGVQYNLGSLWKTRSKIQQAEARVQQVQANQEMLGDGIRMQVTQDYENYMYNTKKIDVYQKAIEQAAENYRITKNKYDNALVTTTDLLDAEVSQLQAKLNAAVAKADAAVSYQKLLQTTGTLVAQSNK